MFHIIPWLTGIALILFNYEPALQIWPSTTPMGYYSDSITQDKGSSGIRKLASKEGTLSFEYTLGDKFQFPYIGVTFDLDSGQTFFDLSRYDHVQVDIDAVLSRHIPLVINQDIKNYSNPEEGLSYRPLTRELVYEKGKRSYVLPLQSFETPSWWFGLSKLTETDLGEPDYSRIHNIQFHNCQLLPRFTKETFTLHKLKFYKDMKIWWLIALGFVGVFYLTWFAIHYFKGPMKKIFPRKELVVGNVADEETKKVLDYVAQHYSNSELSLEVMQKDLGMSETKLSNIVREVSQMGFKRYLNHIRLEEAKRLLKETDRQIMDIAYKVGYGNISHFNRVFKEETGMSPNEYRRNP